MAFPVGWGRRCALTIDHTQVGSDVTDFPILLNKTNLPQEMYEQDSGHSALNGGGDIRFSSDSAGANRLACEIVNFGINNDPALAYVEIYVKVPSISSSVDTVIYVWYEKAGETQPAVSDTYGRNATWSNGYVAVYHFNEDTQSTATSATGSNDGTYYGTAPNSVDGAFDDSFAQDLNGETDGDYMLSGDIPFRLTDDFALSFWMKINAEYGTDPCFVQKGNSSVGNSYCFNYTVSNNRVAFIVDSTQAQGATSLTVGSWYHHTGRFDQTEASDTALFRNGVSVATAENGSTVDVTGSDFAVGYDFVEGSDDRDAQYDELRVASWASSGSRRTDDWIELEYYTMSIPHTLVSEGTPETPSTFNKKPNFFAFMPM